MTERERFIKTLRREPVPGLVPTFELEFFLTMEALGRVHHSQRRYGQWEQMSARERALHLRDEAEIFVAFAEKYGHSAIHVNSSPGGVENVMCVLRNIRELSGDKFALLVYCDPTFSIPSGRDMEDFSVRLYEDGEALHEEAQRRLEGDIRRMERITAEAGLCDGVVMCSDYCFNTNPFFSRDMFAEYIVPYLKQAVDACRGMGLCTIKHTDGNIMPIIDLMVECGPDALHSLDPQGGVDLAAVSRDWGDKVALCGNVNCALLQTGTLEQCDADIRRSLRDGMARGKGYVFCTSNCAYTGLPLERYERMIKIWRGEGSASDQGG
ncbi:MAG: uroporphyrinogen decarboxylase family protein [Oscillospiraceae bacterium]|nr:uroporphyrinogen decarboxylase family protein [Oscillospiraceae bacterium]